MIYNRCTKRSCENYEKGECGLAHISLSRYGKCKDAQNWGLVGEYRHWKVGAGLKKKVKHREWAK